MKRIMLLMAVAMIAASCKVSDADFDNPTTDAYMKEYCNELFVDKVRDNLQYFYNAYYIGRFISGDAQMKVSPEYDLIRTGLTEKSGTYIFEYDPYDFKGEDFFSDKGACSIQAGYWYSMMITAVAEGRWAMVMNEGTTFEFTVKDETQDGIVLDMNVSGVKTEESAYTACFNAEGVEVDIRHRQIGDIESMSFFGMMNVDFRKDEQPLKTCSMTFDPDGSIRSTIVDYMTD